MVKKEMKNKKAEMTSKTLITIILLVVGFGIILFLYFQLGWTDRVDREVCHQSVIYRATLPSFAGLKEYVPLKCNTEKICITSGLIGGKCDEFENIKGVVKAKVKNVDDIEKIIARDVIDCWEMMGQGKVSVFSQWLAEDLGMGTVYPTCVICSRIAFDKDKLQDKGIDLNEMDVEDYMMKHAIPNKDISYYGYLVGSGGKVSLKKDFEILPAKRFDFKGNKIDEEDMSEGTVKTQDFTSQDSGETEELAVMFMQISAPEYSDVFSNLLKIGGVSALASFWAAPRLTTKAAGGAVSYPIVTLGALAIFGGYEVGSIAYNRAITAGYCGDVSAGDEARKGCSVVRTVNYDVEEISKYCATIESIP